VVLEFELKLFYLVKSWFFLRSLTRLSPLLIKNWIMIDYMKENRINIIEK
jgi:hypothetical protein